MEHCFYDDKSWLLCVKNTEQYLYMIVRHLQMIEIYQHAYNKI